MAETSQLERVRLSLRDIEASFLVPGCSVVVSRDSLSRSSLMREAIATADQDDKTLAVPHGVLHSWQHCLEAMQNEQDLASNPQVVKIPEGTLL